MDAGRGGAERSIQSTILLPFRPSHASHDLKMGLQMGRYWCDWVIENSMYVCLVEIEIYVD
jgi:hypothetical protein